MQKDLVKQAALIGVSILLTGVFLVSAASEKVGRSDVKDSLTTVSETECVRNTESVDNSEPYVYVVNETEENTLIGSHEVFEIEEPTEQQTSIISNDKSATQRTSNEVKVNSVDKPNPTTKRSSTQPRKTASVAKPTLTMAKKDQSGDSRILPNSSDLTTIENEILSLINADRANKNIKVFSNNASLKKSAATRCNELWSAFSHTRPNKSSWITAVESSHQTGAQEVLASTTSINKNTRTSIGTSSGVSQFKGTKSELSLAAKNLFYYYCNDSGAYKTLMNSSYVVAGISVTAKYEHTYSNVLSFRCAIIVAKK